MQEYLVEILIKANELIIYLTNDIVKKSIENDLLIDKVHNLEMTQLLFIVIGVAIICGLIKLIRL